MAAGEKTERKKCLDGWLFTDYFGLIDKKGDFLFWTKRYLQNRQKRWLSSKHYKKRSFLWLAIDWWLLNRPTFSSKDTYARRSVRTNSGPCPRSWSTRWVLVGAPLWKGNKKTSLSRNFFLGSVVHQKEFHYRPILYLYFLANIVCDKILTMKFVGWKLLCKRISWERNALSHEKNAVGAGQGLLSRNLIPSESLLACHTEKWNARPKIFKCLNIWILNI